MTELNKDVAVKEKEVVEYAVSMLPITLLEQLEMVKGLVVENGIIASETDVDLLITLETIYSIILDEELERLILLDLGGKKSIHIISLVNGEYKSI